VVAADAVKTSAARAASHADVERELREAGIEIVGTCEGLSQRADIMSRSPLLQDLTPAEADIVGASMLRVRARAGQVLMAEGDPSDWLMLLLAGTADIGKRKVGAESDAEVEGENARIGVVREGAVLGEMSMFDGEPRYASCSALSDMEAAVLTRAAVAGLLHRHPAIGAKLLVKLTQILAQRLRNTSNQLVKALARRR